VVAAHWYRARPPADVAAELEGAPGSAAVRVCPSVREGLERARAAARADGGNVLVTGSNFLVAEALDRLGVDDLNAPPRSEAWDTGRPLRGREPVTDSESA